MGLGLEKSRRRRRRAAGPLQSAVQQHQLGYCIVGLGLASPTHIFIGYSGRGSHPSIRNPPVPGRHLAEGGTSRGLVSRGQYGREQSP